MKPDERERLHAALHRCAKLAEEALARGCDPFIVGQIARIAEDAIQPSIGANDEETR